METKTIAPIKKDNIKIEEKKEKQTKKEDTKEKKILEKMLRSPGKVFTREEIGKIIKIATALQGAISGGNAAITFELGGTAVTGGAITVAHSGSAAGDVDTAEPTAANVVAEDGRIEMITDGGSTGTQKLNVTFTVRR